MKHFWQHCIKNCKKELAGLLFLIPVYILLILSGLSYGSLWVIWPHLLLFGLAIAGLTYMLFQTYKRK
jgi:hypothetical protein